MVFNLSISSSDDGQTPALTPVASPRACSGCVGVIGRFDGPGLQDRSRDGGAVGQMQNENPLGSNDWSLLGIWRRVEDVKVDGGANNIVAIGKVDPAKPRERLEEKTQRKFELVSHSAPPAPPEQPKEGGGGEKKPESKKADEGKKKEVEDEQPKESTVVLKIPLHCSGCAKKIKSVLLKFKGVNSATVDVPKDLITLKGTMEVNVLAPNLQMKLRRSVEVIPPKKEEAAADKKKDKPAAGGGDGEKDSGDGGKKKEEGNVL